ncbi:MAG TPA: heavy metal-binding domain-containing protein [Fimbriimonadaceae bacterium]|nr:heavy metal-binding domain-containing protein [Fimbriimonadaceae bacterium]
MRLFGGGSGDGEAERLAQERQEASIAALNAGGLPLNATERLKEQASRQGTDKHFFTSDLSVNEFLLAREMGYESLGLVMGSSVYQIGWQFMPSSNWWYQSGELQVMSQAQSEARQLAMNRMEEEARLLGADGVVGVRLTRRVVEGHLIEFMAVGTAVRHPESRKRGDGRPFLSDLSGQGIWQLEEAGFVPVGFGFGTCVYFQIPDWRGQNVMWSWSNGEMVSLTGGFYAAREIAMERLTDEFEQTDADGIVGVELEVFAEPRTDDHDHLIGLIIHYTAYGTAISRMPTRVDLDIHPVLPLVDNQ